MSLSKRDIESCVHPAPKIIMEVTMVQLISKCILHMLKSLLFSAVLGSLALKPDLLPRTKYALRD